MIDRSLVFLNEGSSAPIGRPAFRRTNPPPHGQPNPGTLQGSRLCLAAGHGSASPVFHAKLGDGVAGHLDHKVLITAAEQVLIAADQASAGHDNVLVLVGPARGCNGMADARTDAGDGVFEVEIEVLITDRNNAPVPIGRGVRQPAFDMSLPAVQHCRELGFLVAHEAPARGRTHERSGGLLLGAFIPTKAVDHSPKADHHVARVPVDVEDMKFFGQLVDKGREEFKLVVRLDQVENGPSAHYRKEALKRFGGVKVEPKLIIEIDPGRGDIAEIERQCVHQEMGARALMADHHAFLARDVS